MEQPDLLSKRPLIILSSGRDETMSVDVKSSMELRVNVDFFINGASIIHLHNSLLVFRFDTSRVPFRCLKYEV